MRYLLAVLVMGLLAACELGASSPSAEPLPSIGTSVEASPIASESEDADVSFDASASASATADASDDDDMTAMSCEDVWAEIDLADINTVSDLEEIASDVDTTLEDCESLDDWLDAAEDALPMLDGAALEGWAAARCSQDDTLSQSPVCVEINS